jgi:hypothetical protein
LLLAFEGNGGRRGRKYPDALDWLRGKEGVDVTRREEEDLDR